MIKYTLIYSVYIPYEIYISIVGIKGRLNLTILNYYSSNARYHYTSVSLKVNGTR